MSTLFSHVEAKYSAFRNYYQIKAKFIRTIFTVSGNFNFLLARYVIYMVKRLLFYILLSS